MFYLAGVLVLVGLGLLFYGFFVPGRSRRENTGWPPKAGPDRQEGPLPWQQRPGWPSSSSRGSAGKKEKNPGWFGKKSAQPAPTGPGWVSRHVYEFPENAPSRPEPTGAPKNQPGPAPGSGAYDTGTGGQDPGAPPESAGGPTTPVRPYQPQPVSAPRPVNRPRSFAEQFLAEKGFLDSPGHSPVSTPSGGMASQTPDGYSPPTGGMASQSPDGYPPPTGGMASPAPSGNPSTANPSSFEAQPPAPGSSEGFAQSPAPAAPRPHTGTGPEHRQEPLPEFIRQTRESGLPPSAREQAPWQRMESANTLTARQPDPYQEVSGGPAVEGVLFLDREGGGVYTGHPEDEALRDPWRTRSWKRLGPARLRLLHGDLIFQAAGASFVYRQKNLARLVFYDEALVIIPREDDLPVPIFVSPDSARIRDFLDGLA